MTGLTRGSPVHHGASPLVRAMVSIVGLIVVLTSSGLGSYAAATERGIDPVTSGGAPRGLGSVTPTGGSEPLPDYFYGSSAVPPGTLIDRVYNRAILPSSVVFLQVDTTTWPQSDLSLPELMLVGQGDGYFDVKALTDQNAPSPGIPYTYVVFNARITGAFTAGDDGFIAGTGYNGSVSSAAVKSTSVVFLTPRAIGEPRRPLQPLKVNNHGTGFFTVTTTTDIPPSGGEHFNYLIVNEVGFAGGQLYSGCRTLCGSYVVQQGKPNVGVPFAGVSAPAAVLVTEDVTKLPSDTALSGIKVNNHGAGFFTVTTDNLSAAPSTQQGGIPFNFVVIQPPHAWEEYGPTGRSGNTWTIAADPSDPGHTWYVGSMHGGVWKSSDAGDTWYQAWKDGSGAQLPSVGVYSLSFSPQGHLFALTAAGAVYRSTDHGLAWSSLGTAPVTRAGTGGPYYDSAFVVADAFDVPIVCGDAGLVRLASGSWVYVGGSATGSLRCSHVVIDGGTIYATFREAGLYRLDGPGTWTRLKEARSTTTPTPIRIAMNGSKIVVNDDCNVWVRSRADLTRSDVLATWGSPITGATGAKVCDATADGYSTTAAISPDGSRVVAGGRGAWISTDGGLHFPTHLFAAAVPGTGETHQVLMVNDQMILVAVDGGIRLSTDSGATWREANLRSAEIDGPPNTEFYNLAVSDPNQFGQVLLGGSVQDIGGVGMLGRSTGLVCCTGEFGRVGVATKPSDMTISGVPTSLATMFGTSIDEEGSTAGAASHDIQACTFQTTFAPATHTASGQEGYFPGGTCTTAEAFATEDTVTVMANAPFATNAMLVGGSHGAVAGGVPTSSVLQFRTVLAASNDPVTALAIIAGTFNVSDAIALVGFQSGRVVRVTDPFGQHVPAELGTFAAGPVVGFANRYGDPNELYIAYTKQVFGTTNAGSSWTALLPAQSAQPPTQPATVADALALSDIVGVVRDPAHPVLYLAFGRRLPATGESAYGPTDVAPGSAWYASVPFTATSQWNSMNEGLPPGLPITGIGLSANKALFISTQGRGIWWRRDVVSGLPNSGVNSPEGGSSAIGQTVVFDTQCTYAGGWRHIIRLEFKLAMGHGPGDDAPAAAWLAVDTRRNVIQLFDPRAGRWLEGTPGSSRSLTNGWATLRLADSGFSQLDGAAVPTVDIRWALTFLARPQGDLEQYLRVTDDRGDVTSWDRVGSWSVTRP
jgi:hypothetical protein